ncbi:MAG: TPM domain-containing protein, partial [Spirochaetia bacterium]|nr:TPM domain-containing protein [Spirochaetia bacterium]
YRTRDGTGILIFISLFERRIQILADHGLTGVVTQDEWDNLVSDLSQGLQSGRPAAAIIQAVNRCGALAARRGPDRRLDDNNELGDALRIRPS